MPNIQHTRSTVSEGLSLLFWIGLLDVIFVLVLVVWVPRQWPDEFWGLVFGWMVLTIVSAVGVWIAVQMIRARGVFECHLNECELHCVALLTGADANFTIALADIDKIEKISDSDSRR